MYVWRIDMMALYWPGRVRSCSAGVTLVKQQVSSIYYSAVFVHGTARRCQARPYSTSESILRMSTYEHITTYAVIDLDAIARNVRAIKAHIGPHVAIYGVVKANAYGHGAGYVAQTLIANGVQALAVGRTDEGVQLRRLGINVPILNLCYTLPGEARLTVEHDLISAVNSLEGAQALSAAGSALGKRVPVHIKVDTGMGRYGQFPDEVLPFVRAVSALPNLTLDGIFTHFATADEADKTFAQQQFSTFKKTLGELEEAGFHFRVRHAANSAATLDMPESHLDAVRPGIILYGMYPSTQVRRNVALTPALTLKSHLGRVRTLPAGASVGYGRSFIAQQPTSIGLVPVGYGDGFHRLHGNRGQVLINGQPAPIVGRVCMDQFMVDLSAVPNPQEGDEVVLIGRQDNAEFSAEDVARVAETINYEVTTGLTRRIPRVYVRQGQVIDVVRLTNCDY